MPALNRGLSLIEVILALGLLPVLVLSLFFLFTRGLKLQRQADDLTRASEVGRRMLEATRTFPYANIPVNTSFDGRNGQPRDANGFPPVPYPAYSLDQQTYRLRVETADDGGARAIKVEVFWPGNHRLVLETRLLP